MLGQERFYVRRERFVGGCSGSFAIPTSAPDKTGDASRYAP